MYDVKTYLSQDRIEVTGEFVERNNLKLRTAEEVKEKILSISGDDFFGFQSGVLANYLTAEMIDELYPSKDGEDPTSSNFRQIVDIKEAAQDFLDYMNFAWGKAEDQRGLSAGRSIEKLGTWLWLLNRDDLVELIFDDDLYNPYGAPALIAVCEKMGIPVPESLVEFAGQKIE